MAKDNNVKLKEWDDTHIPRGKVAHHETGIPKKYWVAIGDDRLINNYSEFIDWSLNRKPLANNASPSFATQDIEKAKTLAKRAVVKFPGKYVFVGVDDTSKGMMTQKNHLRSSIRSYYDPCLGVWSDNTMYESENNKKEEESDNMKESIIEQWAKLYKESLTEEEMVQSTSQRDILNNVFTTLLYFLSGEGKKVMKDDEWLNYIQNDIMNGIRKGIFKPNFEDKRHLRMFDEFRFGKDDEKAALPAAEPIVEPKEVPVEAEEDSEDKEDSKKETK